MSSLKSEETEGFIVYSHTNVNHLFIVYSHTNVIVMISEDATMDMRYIYRTTHTNSDEESWTVHI